MSEPRALVIGSGVAGLTFALRVAERGSVTILTKKDRADSNTNYAQGGIAAVMDPGDSVRAHVRDTLIAGAGLCHRARVERVVREGPARVRELMAWGVSFSRAGGGLALGREGGHSHRRIVHAADRTGRELERGLLEAVAAHPRIAVLEDHIAVDLIVGTDAASGGRRCAGALVLDEARAELVPVHAAVTLLATGGFGRIYRHTTNPAIATGDGVAMAFRAGVALANLEFVQFHPTALYPADGRAVLISEAVRGEGAVLRRIDGTPLLEGVHPLGSLAPRDVVARAIDLALKESGDPHVLLDASAIGADAIEQRFPNILAECRAAGYDLAREPVPVVPAAHYACGGIWTDLRGRTSLPGLFAAGEVTCTGVHGANRLASNSLLEALVVTHHAAAAAAAELDRAARPLDRPAARAPVAAAEAHAAEEGRAITQDVRCLLWENAGIVRTTDRLEAAAARLQALDDRARRLLDDAGAWPPALEARSVVQCGRLVVRCALDRCESRGLHFTLDHPHRDNERGLKDTFVLPYAGGPGEVAQP